MTHTSTDGLDPMPMMNAHGMLYVCLQECDGRAIPIDQLVPRLMAYLRRPAKLTNSSEPTYIVVVYKAENGDYVQLDYKDIEHSRQQWLKEILPEERNPDEYSKALPIGGGPNFGMARECMGFNECLAAIKQRAGIE